MEGKIRINNKNKEKHFRYDFAGSDLQKRDFFYELAQMIFV